MRIEFKHEKIEDALGQAKRAPKGCLKVVPPILKKSLKHVWMEKRLPMSFTGSFFSFFTNADGTLNFATASKAAGAFEAGGTVKPYQRQLLAIPLQVDRSGNFLSGAKPRPIYTKGGLQNSLVMMKNKAGTEFLALKLSKGRILPQYILREFVTLSARKKYLAQVWEEALPLIQIKLDDLVASAMNTKNTEKPS